MASLFFYKKKDETNIFDLIYFKDGKLELEEIKNILEGKSAKYNSDKIFNEEGYTQIVVDLEKGLLSSTYIFKNKLGQYTTIEYDDKDDELKIKRNPYFYFGQSRLLVKDDLNIMVKANYSSEESSKGKCLLFLDEIGIDIESVKFSNEVFKYIKDNYNWKRIKLQRIEREKDSTKNISYEVDPSSDKESEVDKIYSECGVFESIAFNIPFIDSVYLVKLYRADHKVTVDESQFKTKELFEEFCLYLMSEIMSIIHNETLLNEGNGELDNEGDD
ncbi:hypothetical protein [Clostridium ihumii]|uniref:hypothetical protein n=1 Tax=Clostridium ihumii TaxID=1470356 RepID=UPI000550060D|nr:hypothetical protein [Clostridium ihumii]